MNDKYIQIRGPFAANEDIITTVKSANPNFQYATRVGIQAKPTHLININGQKFEIGKTEILELSEVQITSLFFLQNELESTIVDLVAQ